MTRRLVLILALIAGGTVVVAVSAGPASALPGQRIFDAIVQPGTEVPIPGGVPVNVIYTDAADFGEISRHPCGTPHIDEPAVVPVEPGRAADGLVFTSSGGQCLTTSTRVHLYLDEWALPTGSFHGVTETGIFSGAIGAGQTAQVTAVGGSVPTTGVTGVALVVEGTSVQDTFLTVYSCASPRPFFASVGVQGTHSNMVYVPMGQVGPVCVYNNSGSAQVEVSVVGWWDATVSSTGPPTRPWIFDGARAPGFVAETPHRLFDSRTLGTTGLMQPGVVRSFPFPAEQYAVSLNVTVTEAQASGYLTVFPCDGLGGLPDSPPLASSLNYAVGQTVPNAVMVGTGVGATNPSSAFVCFVSQERTHLVVDQNGYFVAPGQGDGYQPLDPARVLDTRDGTGRPSPAPVPRDGTIELQVTGRGSVPASGVSAVALNMTVTGTQAAGFLTVWPCGQARPQASSLNYGPPTPPQQAFTRANLVNVQVGTGGRVCIYSQEQTEVVADVSGWYGPTAPTGFVPFDTPTRLFDSRNAASGLQAPVVRSGGTPTSPLRSGSEPIIPIDDRDPTTGFDIEAVVMNTTVVDNSAEGFLTAYPCGTAPPLASNLNYDPPRTVPNLTVVRLGVPGVCLFPSRDTHTLADLAGFFTASLLDVYVPTLFPGSPLPG